MSWSELAPLAPLLWLTVGGVVILMVEAFLPRRGTEHLSVIAAIFLVIAGVATNRSIGAESHSLFNGAIRADAFSGFFNLVFIVVGLLTVSLGAVYFRRERDQVAEFYPLVLFAIVGMMVLAAASDMISLFLGLELMSIALYILTASQRHSLFSNEAGFKYLILGAFSSAFLLYGMALLYGTTGSTQLSEIAKSAGGNAALASNPLFWAGWGLLLVGLGFKVALVPFHMWTPDVYEGAPSPVAGFMAAGVKAAAFAAFVRVAWTGMPILMEIWQPLLTGLAVVSMVFGNLVALAQSSLKRMLAYSAIAHAGYVLVGILAIGPETTDPATRGILFYLAVYALANVGAFAVVTFVSRADGEKAQLAGFAGLARRHPLVAAALAVCMLSLAGVPPTAGFWGKLYVFEAAVRAGYTKLAVVALLNSAVAMYYYLRVVVFLYMREPGEEAYGGDDVQAGAAVAAAAALLLWIGLFPSSPLAELARLGAAALARSF